MLYTEDDFNIATRRKRSDRRKHKKASPVFTVALMAAGAWFGVLAMVAPVIQKAIVILAAIVVLAGCGAGIVLLAVKKQKGFGRWSKAFSFGVKRRVGRNAHGPASL